MDNGGYEDAQSAYLIARQMDVYVDPDLLTGGDRAGRRPAIWKLVDVEDGDEAEITVSGRALLRRYKQNLATRTARRPARLLQPPRRDPCLFTGNDVPFERLVLTYLRQARVWFDEK